MTQSRPRWLLFALFVTVLAVGNVVLTQRYLTAPYPGHADFLSQWEAARTFWLDGFSPYGAESRLNIQTMLYGRPALPHENPADYVYPFYVILLLWPLVHLSYDWASAIWMVLLEGALLLCVYFSLDILRWRPRPWLLALLALWSLTNYYSARGLILGQMALASYFFQMVALWAYARQRFTLGGIALAATMIKPQMVILIAPLLLLWALRMKQFRFVVAFAGTFAVMNLLSFLAEPTWLTDWLREVGQYSDEIENSSIGYLGSPLWIVEHFYLPYGAFVEWGGRFALSVTLLWSWYTVLVQKCTERFLWVTVLTITITHLVALQTATTHYMVFTLPILFYLKQIDLKLTPRGAGGIVIILALLIIIPWAHFLLTVEDSLEHPSMFLPLPIGMLGILWWTRKMWWMDRSANWFRPVSETALKNDLEMEKTWRDDEIAAEPRS